MAFYFSYFRREDYLFSDSVVRRVANLSQYSAIFARVADDLSFYTYYTLQGNERLDQISEQLYGTPEYYWTIPLLNTSIVNIWKDLIHQQTTLDKILQQRYPGDALIIADEESIISKFQLGERLTHSPSGTSAELVNTFPSLGYLRVVDIENGFPGANTTFDLVGETSGDTVTIANLIPYFTAPSYYETPDGDIVLSTDETGVAVTIRDIETRENDQRSQIRVIRQDRIREVVAQFIKEMKRGG